MLGHSKEIPGYAYGADTVETSSISLKELQELKVTVGLREEDERYLRLAGEVLGDQVKQVVEHWRSRIIASIPNLARHIRSPEGNPLPEYLAKSNQRFEQWILDTCLRPYDQTWLDYHQEIALRHTSLKKNLVDRVQSTDHVPLRDIIAFIPVAGKKAAKVEMGGRPSFLCGGSFSSGASIAYATLTRFFSWWLKVGFMFSSRYR
jgi:hypothetical protein